MTLQFTITTIFILASTRVSSGGVLSYENNPQEDYHDHHHVSVASSFMHFHGPVEGPEFEVKVPYVLPHHSDHNHLNGQDEEEEEEHYTHGYTHDYVANPKYEFSYGVEDHHTGDFHGQKEVRDGDSVSGEYSIQEPGGGIRTVTYKADKDGFHAVVHTSGKNDHSGATYTTHSEAQDHQYQHQHQQYQQHQQQQQHNVHLPTHQDEGNQHYQYPEHEEYA